MNLSHIPSSSTWECANVGYHRCGNSADPTRQSPLVTEGWWWYRFSGENDETIFHHTANFQFDENEFGATITMQLFDDRLFENRLFMLRERTLTGIPIEGERQIDLFHNSDIDLGHNVPDNDAADAFIDNQILVAGTDGPAYLYYEDTTANSMA